MLYSHKIFLAKGGEICYDNSWLNSLFIIPPAKDGVSRGMCRKREAAVLRQTASYLTVHSRDESEGFS